MMRDSMIALVLALGGCVAGAATVIKQDRPPISGWHGSASFSNGTGINAQRLADTVEQDQPPQPAWGAIRPISGEFSVAAYQSAPKIVLRATGSVTSGIGINAHHPSDEDFDGMKAAGFSLVRTDLTWKGVEVARGVYDWREADHRVAAMAARNLRPILILDYSNPLYEIAAPDKRRGWMAPRDPQGVAAFIRWATAAAKRYSQYRPIWELWNEPDTDFWAPHADPSAYLTLAKGTCAGIRAVDSGATIWAPALSSWHNLSALDSPFLKTVLASSLPSCLSAISVHPYARWWEIDRTPEYWQALRALPTQAGRPFVSSESGISNVGARTTAATQASYMVRMFLYNHMAHVPASIWYDWRNDGRDPMQSEHNFGLLDANSHPKPAFVALTTLIRQVAGLNRQCLVRDRDRALLYNWSQDRPGQLVLISWANSQGSQGRSAEPTGGINVDLVGEQGAPSAFDLYGQRANSSQIGPASWRIDGGGQPYYIHYTGRLPSSCA